MWIEHMGYHPELVMTPLSIDIVTAMASTSDSPPDHTIMIEAYEAEDFIQEISEDGAMLFTCVLTDPIHVRTTTVIRNTPLTSALPDLIPETERQALTMQLPKEYHEFHDVFMGTAASYLLPHHMYDIKFEIKEGRQVP
jgi:hypothetical protein